MQEKLNIVTINESSNHYVIQRIDLTNGKYMTSINMPNDSFDAAVIGVGLTIRLDLPQRLIFDEDRVGKAFKVGVLKYLEQEFDMAYDKGLRFH